MRVLTIQDRNRMLISEISPGELFWFDNILLIKLNAFGYDFSAADVKTGMLWTFTEDQQGILDKELAITAMDEEDD